MQIITLHFIRISPQKINAFCLVSFVSCCFDSMLIVEEESQSKGLLFIQKHGINFSLFTKFNITQGKVLWILTGQRFMRMTRNITFGKEILTKQKLDQKGFSLIDSYGLINYKLIITFQISFQLALELKITQWNFYAFFINDCFHIKFIIIG